MKNNFVFYAVFVILFCKVCSGCFQDDSISNQSVQAGTSFYEECCCTDPYIFNLFWLDPHNRVIEVGPGTDSNVYIEEQGDCINLHIPNASKTLSGAYRCITTVNGVKHSQIHNLDVYDPLYFYGTEITQFLVLGIDYLIKCQAIGASPPIISWYIGKNEQYQKLNNGTKYLFTPEGLLVKNVSHDDGGIYKCSASVPSTGEENERDIEVIVKTPPVIKNLTASPEDVVTANESLIIQCIAEGIPEPLFEWKKIPKSDPEEKTNASWIQEISNTIRFDKIQPDDDGTYECIVRNDVGISTQQINITVFIPPEIIGFNNMTAVEGREIAFYCSTTGVPIPNVTITYEGKTLDEERETEYEDFIPNYSLLKIDRSKEGIYICNVSNDVGTDMKQMYLSVLHKPYLNDTIETLWGWSGETVNISCANESNPPANITWSYTSGNYSTIEKQEYDNIVLDYETSMNHTFLFTDEFAPFGKHECRAQNEYGVATKTYYIRKGFLPSAVSNVTTIDRSATSATFYIEPPTDYEGPNVIGFIAVYDEADNFNVTNIHPDRTWALGVVHKLEKLRPNTTYFITFAAINRIGTGEWSGMIQFDTMDKSAPEPPIWDLDALKVAATKVLKWKAPENNGEPIDCYFLRYCPMNGVLDETLCKEYQLEAVTEVEVSDLQHNTTYYLELTAHNTEGNSTLAATSLTIPGAVTEAPAPLLSGGVLIGISVLVVIACILLLDILFFVWKKQGIIATCFYKKNKKSKPNPLNSRDKKGLLKDNGESSTDDTLRRPNNGHKEYEYNKTTGIITGKHSSV